MSHFHIHWGGKDTLDWERFASRAEAEASAKLLVRQGETYTIDERAQDCERCQAALLWKLPHETQENSLSPKANDPKVKYLWQQTLLDALAESRSEQLIRKVSKCQREISERLCQLTPTDSDEQLAIRDALKCLRALIPERKQPKSSSGKKDIA